MGEVQKVTVVPLDVLTLSFKGLVDASSKATLVSKRITFPFTLEKVRAQFALNTNRELRIEFYISPDDSTPTDKPLTGHSVLSTLGQVAYIVGDDEPIEIPHRLAVKEAGMYIKVFADNQDSYPHSIVAQVFISRVLEET